MGELEYHMVFPRDGRNKMFAEIFQSPKPLIMGILNATPDSFSDGGLFSDPECALHHAQDMVRQGADIIDVGGESTRPGAFPVGAAEQIARVVPVIEALRHSLPGHILLSIDTSLAEVAAAGLGAGAALINDVTAGTGDAELLNLAAKCNVPIVLMHMQGTPRTMQDYPRYVDVVNEVLGFLLARAEAAQAAGVPRENIILDPGIGFGKGKVDNLTLLANLRRFTATGYATLLGTSRKRFMGSVCNENRPRELVAATVATTAIGVMAGITIFRVHDIRDNRQAADVAFAIKSQVE
jgi:dihydropteroate synthase